MSGPLPGPEKTRPTQLGVFDKPGQRTLTGIEIAALALNLKLIYEVLSGGFDL